MPEERKLFGFSRNVFFAGLVSFFMDVSSEMIYPLVPIFLASVLGVNKSTIGLIEGIAESTASLLKAFSGWISDRIGKRKGLMLAGYAISTLSRPIMVLAGSWQQILASRFVDRLGKGIRTAPRDAIIAESSEQSNLARSFSFHRSMDTMGAVIGPSIALILLQRYNNVQVVFLSSMIPAVIAVLIIVAFIKEKTKSAGTSVEPPRLTFKHFDGKVRFFILIATLFALGNSSDVFLILRASQLGIPTMVIPVVYLMFNLIYSHTAIPGGMVADNSAKNGLFSLDSYCLQHSTMVLQLPEAVLKYGFYLRYMDCSWD